MSNALVPIDRAIRFGEVIPPNASVCVIGTTHPLNAVVGDRIKRYLDVGLTIEEMLFEALEDRPQHRMRRDFIVRVDGHPIEERNWHRVRAKAGTVVTFLPRLQNNDTLKTVLGVAVAVGALLIAAPTGGLSLALADALGTSAYIASALAAASIIPAGTLVLNALFSEVEPVPPNGGTDEDGPSRLQLVARR